jgi:hypothetical protein
MSRAIGVGSVVLLLACAGPAWGEDQRLAGEWISRDRKTLVTMAPCPGNSATTCATILAESPPDGENSRIGEMIGIGFQSRADGTWAGQVVAQNGIRIPATLTMPGPAQLTLQVCIMAVLCDGASYFRVQP